MIDEKKFARMITKMFTKGTTLKIVDDVVTDGFLLYKGDLQKDVFYRLRLEALAQMDMGFDQPQQLFDKVKDYIDVDMHLKYTLNAIRNIDVYAVGLDPNSTKLPYIGFDSKFRELFTSGWTVKLDYKDEPMLLSHAYISTEFGELLVAPCKINDQIYR